MFKPQNDELVRSLKIFLKIYIPLILLIAGVSLAYYRSVEIERTQAFMIRTSDDVAVHADAFHQEFKSIVSDLKILSSNHELQKIVNGLEEANASLLANEYLPFIADKKTYDKIQFINDKGIEVIRVDFNNGKPAVVPPNQLQDKSKRYYFKEISHLKKGKIYLSPFDLNVEHGMIEQPLKPLIRFGMPIFNERGEKRGIIVLSCLGQNFIKYLDKFRHNAPGYDMLVNDDGYFLKAMRSEDEWGFMFPERSDKTFANLYGARWNKINKTQAGQFMDEQGLFTFATIFPLDEVGSGASSGQSKAKRSGIKAIDRSHYMLKIICFTPTEDIKGLTHELKMMLILFDSLFALLSGIGTWFLARTMVKRRIAEDHIEHMAHFDLLTGLPNRPLLYDRMDIALKNAERNNLHLAVLFLDLDGFKKVNDSLGHDAGDQVLIEVAHRLAHCVRGSDTVARLGGDEFVLVLSSPIDLEASIAIAAQIIDRLSEPIMFHDSLCLVGASIGIAIYPNDGETQDALLSRADSAMYAVKESGKNTYRFSS